MTVNTATTQSLTLTSTGTAPVTVNSAAISGAGFTIVGGTIAGDVEPDAVGDAAGSVCRRRRELQWSADDQQQLVDGQHCGSDPEWDEYGGTSPQLTVSAATLSFGSVTVNTATTQSLTLTSTGTSPVTVNSAVITGAGFTIVGGQFAGDAEPDADADATGSVLSDDDGNSQWQLTINSNSSTGAQRVVTLSGTSTAAPSPQLTISAATLSFGSVTVNTATTQSLTLTSTGTSPVTVNSAVITGAGFTIVEGEFASDVEPDTVVDAAGAVRADDDWERRAAN